MDKRAVIFAVGWSQVSKRSNLRKKFDIFCMRGNLKGIKKGPAKKNGPKTESLMLTRTKFLLMFVLPGPLVLFYNGFWELQKFRDLGF